MMGLMVPFKVSINPAEMECGSAKGETHDACESVFDFGASAIELVPHVGGGAAHAVAVEDEEHTCWGEHCGCLE